MLTYPALLLALAALPAKAQNQTSNSTADSVKCAIAGGYDYANATGNLTFPGLGPSGADTPDWTLNVGLKDTRNASTNSSRQWPLMWLSSSDKNEDLDSPELPFTGCAVSMIFDEMKTSTGSVGELDGCKGVFSDGCYNALVKQAMNNARAQGRSNGNTQKSTTKLCMDFMKPVPEECGEDAPWSGVGATQIFGNGTHGTNGTDGCGDQGVTSDGTVRSTSMSNVYDESYDNFTGYDIMANEARTYMLMAWSRNESLGMDGWGDVRLVCATADQIKKGSRMPESGASGVRSPGIVGLVALVGGVMVMLL